VNIIAFCSHVRHCQFAYKENFPLLSFFHKNPNQIITTYTNPSCYFIFMKTHISRKAKIYLTETVIPVGC